MKKLLVGAFAVLVAVGFLPTTAAWAGVASDDVSFLARINDLRAAKELPALRVDAALTGRAGARAQTMAAENTISHSILSDGLPAGWDKLGENVGMGGTVDGLHTAFVNSPGHYRNLVDPAFDSIGVGIVRVGDTLFVAHKFMQIRTEKAPATVKSAQIKATKAQAATAKAAKAKAARAKAAKAKAAKARAVTARKAPSRTRL